MDLFKKITTKLLFLLIFIALAFLVSLAFLKKDDVLGYFSKITNAQTIQTENNFESTESTSVLTQESLFKEMLEPIQAKPVRLYSTAVGIDAIVEEIGLTEEGALDVPSDWMNLGWFENSAYPGQKGNVIIDGHYDTNTASPAAFWNLKNLKINDKVNVVDEFGFEHSYTVQEIIHVSITDDDRLEKLNKYSGRTLTLITCGGFWNTVANTYDERLIVKAVIND